MLGERDGATESTIEGSPVSRFEDLGPNSGLAEELYQRYLENPAAVDANWRDVLRRPADSRQRRLGGAPACPARTRHPRRRHPRLPSPHPLLPCPDPVPLVLDGDEPEPLRGAAARTVENMEASLAVPTATSVRVVPAKLLEVNRQILNNQLARTGAGKVSFTHLIAYAVLRALDDFPGLNSAYATEAGKPVVVRHQHVNLGLAVDNFGAFAMRRLRSVLSISALMTARRNLSPCSRASSCTRSTACASDALQPLVSAEPISSGIR